MMSALELSVAWMGCWVDYTTSEFAHGLSDWVREGRALILIIHIVAGTKARENEPIDVQIDQP